LASAAANAVLDIVLDDGFLDNVQRKGIYFSNQLALIAAKHKFLNEIRGQGLLVGVVCNDSVVNLDIVKEAETKGLLTVPAGNNVIRLIPPLIITETEIDEGLSLFDQACDSVSR
jgi:acetylornithine/N-succinyldiaminopimelate aminotransferase